ncbi:glucosaminidase domain-containing protein [Maribacter sp. 2307ULW6-5]|uniref:glucosaminidase domain-containing protein n=1 Tax=Maribacter sp. 2307ULW6-5 TaxID=3386275 RepID=UPI0039BCF7D9
MKKMFVLIGLALFLVSSGCKSKKAYRDGLRTKNVQAAKKKKEGLPKETSVALPEDTGEFIRFDIANIDEYVETFAEIAQMNMEAYGIPASITLAQGLLESGFGRGELAQKTNNHFGIKCHKGWEGDYDFHDDDAKGECFRKYNHPLESYRDHSLFLTTRSRYDFLFDYKVTDYKAWARGLKRAGYATDPKYPQKLISLIQKYQLYQYDGVKPRQRNLGPDVAGTESVHVVQKGDTLYSLSKRFYLSVQDLKRMNNLKDETITIGQQLRVR